MRLVNKKETFYTMLIAVGILATAIFLVINRGNNVTSPLIINEVCTQNDTVIYNDIGVYADYIELYNNSNTTLELSEYYLSDQKEQQDMYQMPACELAPYTYTIIFIDMETAGFAVGDKDIIYLSDVNGKVIDMVELPYLGSDKVYARNASTLSWEFNQEPTPGRENIFVADDVLVHDESIEVKFSHPAGFYNEPFNLEITANGDYDIYYTVDGSDPIRYGYYYELPILIEDVTQNDNVYSMITEISVDADEVEPPNYLIDKCNVIRAVAVAPDGTVGKELSATYFVGYEDRYGYEDMYIVSLVTDPENLFDKNKGIYVNGDLADKNWFNVEDPEMSKYEAITNYSSEGKGWQRPAYIEVYNEDKELEYTQNINISIHGGFSVFYPHKGFNILPVVTEDKYVFEGLLGEANTSLMLRPGGFRDWRSTKFRDKLNHKLVENCALTVLRSIPCQVFLDGEYWGAYNLQERIDRGLIAQNFGVFEEDVIIFKNDNVIGADDIYYEEYLQVENYVLEHDMTVDEYYQEMTQMIDIQSFIDFHCFNIYVANCDSLSNNYSCWKTKKISTKDYYDGKWRWVLYDTDDSMGMESELTVASVDSFTGGHWGKTPMTDPLFSSLIRNETFKHQFVERFVEMADTIFAYENVKPLIDQYAEQYLEAATISHLRYDDWPYVEQDYWDEVEDIYVFFEQRREYILAYLKSNLGIEDLEGYLCEKP